MYYLDAIRLAQEQQDVTYEEWCNMYVPYMNPTEEQIERAIDTARTILVRNELLEGSKPFFFVREVSE